jgi:hypothetical protein
MGAKRRRRGRHVHSLLRVPVGILIGKLVGVDVGPRAAGCPLLEVCRVVAVGAFQGLLPELP